MKKEFKFIDKNNEGWIFCKDRLPGTEECPNYDDLNEEYYALFWVTYLVNSDGLTETRKASYRPEINKWYANGEINKDHIIAWMPIAIPSPCVLENKA